MKKRLLIAVGVFLTLITALAIITGLTEKSAASVKESVLRFHIIANSDSANDQEDKLAVRDGIAKLCSELFKESKNKQMSVRIAEENMDVITEYATGILENRGNYDAVNAKICERFFPTRSYEGVTLPAGVYETLDITIGEAKGKNFWCVMFPAICLGASTAEENKHKMSEVLTGDSLQLVVDESPDIVFRFKLLELYEQVKNLIKK